MGDISNKTLVALLVVAIAISLVGTWISVNRISSIPVRITGMQTSESSQTGITWLEIPCVAEITLWVNTVNFSSGYVNTSNGNQYCHIITNATNGVTPYGNSFSGYGAGTKIGCIDFVIPEAFEIQNTGTRALNITMNSSSGPDWLDGSSLEGGYRYRVYEENDACRNTALATDWTNIPTANTEQLICGNITPANTSRDAILVPINITIPSDIAKGTHEDTIIFKGIAIDTC